MSSPDGTLIFVSAAPHCGAGRRRRFNAFVFKNAFPSMKPDRCYRQSPLHLVLLKKYLLLTWSARKVLFVRQILPGFPRTLQFKRLYVQVSLFPAVPDRYRPIPRLPPPLNQGWFRPTPGHCASPRCKRLRNLSLPVLDLPHTRLWPRGLGQGPVPIPDLQLTEPGRGTLFLGAGLLVGR